MNKTILIIITIIIVVIGYFFLPKDYSAPQSKPDTNQYMIDGQSNSQGSCYLYEQEQIVKPNCNK